MRPDPDVLGIYLNDHLAGATTGTLLSQHLAEEMRSTPHGSDLRRVADEIAEDRQHLLEVMSLLGVPARRHKFYAGWLAEKLCLLKLNGRIVRRSHLSTLIELETLRLGIEGKSLLWQTLLGLTPARGLDETRLKDLVRRAVDQAEAVETTRRGTVGAVFR
jgi:hypothetical protein